MSFQSYILFRVPLSRPLKCGWCVYVQYVCICMSVCWSHSVHHVLLYRPGGRGSYGRVFLSPFHFLLLLSNPIRAQELTCTSARTHTPTHKHTHGTHCLSLCVQPWRLQQKPFILSGSQSFRPIRDSHCSEGIQTQWSSFRTTGFISLEDAFRRVCIANNIASANLHEPSWMQFAPQPEAFLQDEKKNNKSSRREQKSERRASHFSFHIVRHPWIISMEQISLPLSFACFPRHR